VHDHAGLDLARARRHERAGALDLDDADAADVHGRERVGVAKRRRRDLEPLARVEDRGALGDPNSPAVDRDLDEALRCGNAHDAHSANTPRFIIADSTAIIAVWPRPQIEASRITWPRSARTAS